VHTNPAKGRAERAGTRANHQYNLLGHIGANASGVSVERLTYHPIQRGRCLSGLPTQRHRGRIYMLEAKVDYPPLANTVYRLKPGDTLFFDAGRPARARGTWEAARA